jgi:hypothetical protein
VANVFACCDSSGWRLWLSTSNSINAGWVLLNVPMACWLAGRRGARWRRRASRGGRCGLPRGSGPGGGDERRASRAGGPGTSGVGAVRIWAHEGGGFERHRRRRWRTAGRRVACPIDWGTERRGDLPDTSYSIFSFHRIRIDGRCGSISNGPCPTRPSN